MPSHTETLRSNPQVIYTHTAVNSRLLVGELRHGLPGMPIKPMTLCCADTILLHAYTRVRSNAPMQSNVQNHRAPDEFYGSRLIASESACSHNIPTARAVVSSIDRTRMELEFIHCRPVRAPFMPLLSVGS